jgi:hypothetical protein
MTHATLQTLLLLGGACHFGILLASALVPRVLDWRRELQALSRLSRHLVWTHGAFIVLTIIGFGAISVLNARALAGGTPLARSVCAFIALFWLTRLTIQLFLFDPRPFLRNTGLKVGYHALTVVFTYLSAVYAAAAVLPLAMRS